MRVAVAGGTGVVGRHVVTALQQAGHEPVVLSRSRGVDLTGGPAAVDAVAKTLAGCAAVVDVASVETLSGSVSKRFFRSVTQTLLTAERSAGVPHHVALSIIGAAEAPAAYYAGKALQEQLVEESGTGWSILRATQFHEFAAQLAGRGKPGRLRIVPAMTSQPVAAAEVGAALAGIAVGEPRGRAGDIAGPRVEDMPTLVRRYLAAIGDGGRVLAVPLPGRWGRALRDGTLLAGPAARLGTQTFDAWLTEVERVPSAE
ncbi:SDR family oxidoreductase [Leifsonia sp. F6_8S_P_1B]|uniref:SDR family oxidoreductase n=1 Tax=Leifsonia williamsii TaxID=3035919 RepID=A0ABT8K802_9MICO|nr:SDR family oxidoreductase [Leifsonia williamsii]MDN4613123.1 SDR family oxidoreductase [Leifsonia williamsii]